MKIPELSGRTGIIGVVLCLLIVLSSPMLASAAPGDEHWDAQFGAPGASNIIFAVAANNGLVYAAGEGSGSRTNTPLNVWDGKQRKVAAMFNGPSSQQINDLAFVGNTLYAAGNFTSVNGVAAVGLAKWDGPSWSSMGFSGIAYALAVDGNNLYVGGNIRAAGDKPAYNLAHWNSAVNFDVAWLIHPAMLPNRQFQARIFGISGMTNIVEASTNLTSWTLMLTNSDGIYDFTNPSAPGYPYRFYRAVLGP